ncbi:hypothetical protein BGX31_007679 [Mortierella sp. GBA43]|nr:hypothetical protein BGX31_007679 [Mortierella sp. GBA43]
MSTLRRGYWTRNLDTRLGLEQLKFRNVKVQKAFTRVTMKLQYLQGRIQVLEENSLPLHEAQEEIIKDLEDMADQMDGLKQELDQNMKQMDEQMAEEKEQTTIEIRGLTERIQKMEEELKTLRTSNTTMEKEIKSLSVKVSTGSGSEQDDDDYEVQYDDEGNRIERPPKKTTKRSSIHDHHEHIVGSVGSRRLSIARSVTDGSTNGGAMQMVESPVPMPQQLHRGSVGSVHSQGHTRTISSGSNNPPRPLTMDSNQLYRFHPVTNQFIPLSPSAVPAGTSYPGMGAPPAAPAAPALDPKKYVSRDDFEYMQAEVDTLRLNNDRLEGMIRELTMRFNTSSMGNKGQFYPG